MSRSTPRASRTLAAIGVVVISAAALGACGGDSNRAETSPATATEVPDYSSGNQLAKQPAIAKITDPVRRAYVRRVDDVCRRLDRERNAARERASAGAESAEGMRAYDDSIALGERQLREIEAIPTPPGESKLLRTNVFDVLHHQLAVRREMSAALANADVPRLQTLRAQLDSLTQSLLGFARGYGFRVCGED